MDTTKSYNRWIYHLEDELNPDRFRQGDIHNLNISDHFIGLKKRFKEFRLCFIEMLNLSKKQAAAALLQLVFLSDIIYNYLISLQKTSSSISTSPEIRQLYQTMDITSMLTPVTGMLTPSDRSWVECFPMT